MDNTSLHTKVVSLPESLKHELELFLDYLLYKSKNEIPRKHPKAGCMKGTFTMKSDFDEPLEDFKEYTE